MTWTLIGEDTFTESSNTNLESHTPTGTTPLSGWTRLTGSASASMVVDASTDTVGQPYHGGPAFPNAYIISDSANAAQKAECKAAGGSNAGFLIVNGANSTSTWRGYSCQYNAGLNQLDIVRYNNDGATIIGSTYVGYLGGFSGGDTLSLENDGSGNLVFRVNGTSTVTATDTTYTDGKPGLWNQKVSSGTDDFKAYHEAGGGVTVEPGAGSITAAGSAHTITQPQAVAPGAASSVLLGYAPTIGQAQAVAPTAGAVAVTGYAPAVTQESTISPAAGVVEMSGNAPTISQPQSLTPGVGAYDVLGYAPTVSQSVLITPDTAAIVVAGYAVTITQPQSVAPSTGSAAWLGYAPSISQEAQPIQPDAAAMVYEGYMPAVGNYYPFVIANARRNGMSSASRRQNVQTSKR